MTPEELRAKVMSTLNARGYVPLPQLPPPSKNAKLRPTLEIVRRALALICQIDAVLVDDNEWLVPIFLCMGQNNLKDFLTEEEFWVFKVLPAEARDKYRATIGWSMESLWSLAWVLGAPIAPEVNDTMIQPDQLRQLREFVGYPDCLTETAKEVLNRCSPRSAAEVVEREYEFYAGHNGVRSAIAGHPTVPDDFDLDSGLLCIEKRRHGLVWSLSPKVRLERVSLPT